MKNKKWLIFAPLVAIALAWILALAGCGGSNPASPPGGSGGGGATAPSAPTGVTATAGNQQNTLSWTAVTGATSYNIYGGTASSSAIKGRTKIASASASPYIHSALTNGATYYYVVTAVNAAGESSASNLLNATPAAATPPAPPTGVTATASGTSQINVNWTNVTGATGHNIYRSTTSPVASSAANKVNTAGPVAAGPFGNTGLNPGTTYYYVVTALNSYGEGPLSAEASATTIPNPPTITGFTPASGGVGSQVTITGTNFIAVQSVQFANNVTATYTVNSSTQITATVPAGAVTGPITMTTAGGSITSSTSFTVIPAPAITGFTPTNGPVGTSVTITGTNFIAVQSVQFSNNVTATYTVNSSTQITATVPNGATTGPISVTTAGGSANSATSFTVNQPTKILMGGSIQGSPLNLSAIVTTFAGTAASSGATDGTETAARFTLPYDVTTDGVSLYVADTWNNTIRKIVIATGVVTTLAGTGAGGSADGTGTAASFTWPCGVTTDGASLFVVDYWNSTIRKIVIATGVVTTLAGTAGPGGSADGTGTAASFNLPRGVTTDGASLFVADNGNNTIRKIVIATGVVTTLAGTGAAGSADGTGTAASFNYPYGVTTDGTSLYVADINNHTIRKIQ